MAHEVGTVGSGTTSMACLWRGRQSVVAGAGKEVALAACRTEGILCQGSSASNAVHNVSGHNCCRCDCVYSDVAIT